MIEALLSAAGGVELGKVFSAQTSAGIPVNVANFSADAGDLVRFTNLDRPNSETAYAANVDFDGNIYVVFQTVMRKYSPTGVFLEDISLSFAGATALRFNPDGSFIIMGGNSVRKFNSSGTQVWRGNPESGRSFTSCAVDSSGDVIVGEREQVVGGTDETYVVKFSSSGSFLWRADVSVAIGSSFTLSIDWLSLDENDNIYGVYRFSKFKITPSGTVDYSDFPANTTRENGYTALVDDSGNLFHVFTNSTGDIIVQKLVASTGNLVSTIYDGNDPSFTGIYSAVMDNEFNIYISAQVGSSSKVLKVNSATGNADWEVLVNDRLSFLGTTDGYFGSNYFKGA